VPSSAPEPDAPRRLLVVLGYSAGRNGELHPICAARLAYAARIAGETDAVLFSGWSRHPAALPEAELMRRAWAGSAGELLSDPDARITAENAAHAAAHARELGVGEVVVVTSWWHRFRARVLFRRLLPGVRVSVAPVRAPSPPRLILRELVVFPLVPIQLARARRRVASLSPRRSAGSG
jgi:uncharacterized SAM-binding protein YcdF (DUF218 family)